MQVTYNQVKKILDTLPIGYYLGHAIPPVKLSKISDSTYINQITEEITVSFKNVQAMLQNAPDDIDVESVVRGLLYHEVSHAVLTPPMTFIDDFTPRVRFDGSTYDLFVVLGRAYRKKFNHPFPLTVSKDIINIVEDERIETLLKDYYLNVDFRKNVVLLNGITNPEKELENADLLKRLFLVCRYHVGTQKELESLTDLIFYRKKLTNKSEEAEIKCYLDNIETFAITVLRNVNIPTQQDGQNQQSSDGKQSDNKESKDEQSNGTPSPLEISELFKDNTHIRKDAGEIRDKLKKLSTNQEAASCADRLNRIITTAMNKRKMRSGAHTAYAGNIDPRLCSNNDYRWFTKKSTIGAGKRFDKININLFCDNSASFEDDENNLNGLIVTLLKLAEQNKDLTVTTTHINRSIRRGTKEDMFVHCNGGTVLDDSIKTIYPSLQKPNATNWNVVVFDGYCQKPENFTVFNHPNVIMVVDDSNKTTIKTYCPQTRSKIITGNYAEEFEQTVLALLEQALS